jgi:hypothetical protein
VPRWPWTRRVGFALAILASIVAAPGVTRSQGESKVTPSLLDLVLYVEERKARGDKRVEIPLPRGISIDSSGRLPVVIAVTELTETSLGELRGLNAVVQTHDARTGLVQAFVPLRRVKDLAKRPWVRGIWLPASAPGTPRSPDSGG